MSVVIPARDEAADIRDCLAALAAQDHPLEDIEVIVVDGASRDGTAEVARELLSAMRFGRTEVVHNSEASTPSNLNRGLGAASGEFLVRVDARSIVPPHYVRTVVTTLEERADIAVVGGSQRAVARDGRLRSVGIARALNNRWSMGFSRYRRTDVSGPTDTVYLGAFRIEQLRAAGGWDVRFPTNQDFDLNRRMSTQGLVWFVGGLPVGYRPRASFTQLWRQYVRFGRWKAVYWSTTGDVPQRRQKLIVSGPVGAMAVVLAACWRTRTAYPALVAAAFGVGGLVLVEQHGADEPPAGGCGHLAGAAAITVVSGGWLTGVYSGLVTTAIRGLRPPR